MDREKHGPAIMREKKVKKIKIKKTTGTDPHDKNAYYQCSTKMYKRLPALMNRWQNII